MRIRKLKGRFMLAGKSKKSFSGHGSSRRPRLETIKLLAFARFASPRHPVSRNETGYPTRPRGSATKLFFDFPANLNPLSGFSLLEVLMAIAILAVSFTVLLGTQSNHILLSERAEFMSTAVMLAREKMTDTELEYRYDGLPRNDLEEIKPISDQPFGEEFPEFGYELTIRSVTIPIPTPPSDDQTDTSLIANSSAMISRFLSQAMREVRLVVFWESAVGRDQIEVVTHLVDLNTNVGLQ